MTYVFIMLPGFIIFGYVTARAGVSRFGRLDSVGWLYRKPTGWHGWATGHPAQYWGRAVRCRACLVGLVSVGDVSLIRSSKKVSAGGFESPTNGLKVFRSGKNYKAKLFCGSIYP